MGSNADIAPSLDEVLGKENNGNVLLRGSDLSGIAVGPKSGARGDYLVINLDNTPDNGETLRTILEGLGLSGYYTTDAAYLNADSMQGFNTVWIILGVYPNNYALNWSEVNEISEYLSAGGNVYLEGADCFGFDTTKVLIDPLFGVDPDYTSDGACDLSNVAGAPNMLIPNVAGYKWRYAGENNWIDRLVLYEGNPPNGGTAEGFLSNPDVPYYTGVAYNQGRWRTVAVSHELTKNIPQDDSMSLDNLVYTIYQFLTTGLIVYHDVGVSGIASPWPGYVPPETYDVTVKVKNFGNVEDHTQVVAFIEDTSTGAIVWGPYTEEVTVSPGETVSHTFSDPFTAESEKVYHLVAYTCLLEDENNSNDTSEIYFKTFVSIGEVMYVIELDPITGCNTHLGVEFDGNYFYVTESSYNVGGQNHVFVLDAEGNLVKSFYQPTTGWGWRDLAFDCVHCYEDGLADFFYTSCDTNVDVVGLDMTTQEVVLYDSFPGPTNPNRAIAHDCWNDVFYISNFDSPIYEMNRSDTAVRSWPNSHEVYGAAYDPCTRKLWLSTQEMNSYGTYNTIYQFDPATGEFTDTVIEVPSIVGEIDIAGGLAFWGNFMGYRVLIELVQSNPDYIAIINLGPAYKCGDVNNDGVVSLPDVQRLVYYLFGGGPPVCNVLADVNGDRRVSVADVQCLAWYLFGGGTPPNCPCCAKKW